MEGDPGVESEPESPAWESLPEPILANILRRASSPRTFDHGLVCKRWLAVGSQVQEAFDPTSQARDVVVRGISLFPSLTSVTLEEEAICDYVLGAVGAHCRELRHLSLAMEDPDAS